MRISFRPGSDAVRGSIIAAGSVAVVTAALLPFRPYLNATEVSLTLLLVVLFNASVFGSRAGFVASVAGILSFNFFFLPPFHTLNIAGPENWVSFGAFLITALIAGQLSGYARRRAFESEQKQREIARLYNELRGAFEQASQAEALSRSEKLKSALLDAVTHDLRTPLTSIKASVTTLLEDRAEFILDDESRMEFLEIIDEETDRLNDFIDGIVGIAKIEAEALHFRKKESSVEEIVGNALERARGQLAGHNVVIELDSDLPNIYVDAASISEVVYTLLDNAAKYSPRGSRILISARPKSGNMIEIAVQDQGRGIETELREKVFEKFVRGASADIHTTGGGLGLGLAIARGIIESQGGLIHVEDGGDVFSTRFVFELPRGEDPALEQRNNKVFTDNDP